MAHLLRGILGGSWDLITRVISTLIGVISIVTLLIRLVTKSHDPLSRVKGFDFWVQGLGVQGFGAVAETALGGLSSFPRVA